MRDRLGRTRSAFLPSAAAAGAAAPAPRVGRPRGEEKEQVTVMMPLATVDYLDDAKKALRRAGRRMDRSAIICAVLGRLEREGVDLVAWLQGADGAGEAP